MSGTVSAVEKWTFIRTADEVVVGELKLSSYFLSFDGLHVNGTIAADEILYGDGRATREFEYHMVVPCSLRRAYEGLWKHWSETKELLTRKRIWALVKGHGSWTVADPQFAAIYELADRERAIALLNERKQRAQ